MQGDAEDRDILVEIAPQGALRITTVAYDVPEGALLICKRVSGDQDVHINGQEIRNVGHAYAQGLDRKRSHATFLVAPESTDHVVPTLARLRFSCQEIGIGQQELQRVLMPFGPEQQTKGRKQRALVCCYRHVPWSLAFAGEPPALPPDWSNRTPSVWDHRHPRWIVTMFERTALEVMLYAYDIPVGTIVELSTEGAAAYVNGAFQRGYAAVMEKNAAQNAQSRPIVRFTVVPCVPNEPSLLYLSVQSVDKTGLDLVERRLVQVGPPRGDGVRTLVCELREELHPNVQNTDAKDDAPQSNPHGPKGPTPEETDMAQLTMTATADWGQVDSETIIRIHIIVFGGHRHERLRIIAEPCDVRGNMLKDERADGEYEMDELDEDGNPVFEINMGQLKGLLDWTLHISSPENRFQSVTLNLERPSVVADMSAPDRTVTNFRSPFQEPQPRDALEGTTTLPAMPAVAPPDGEFDLVFAPPRELRPPDANQANTEPEVAIPLPGQTHRQKKTEAATQPEPEPAITTQRTHPLYEPRGWEPETSYFPPGEPILDRPILARAAAPPERSTTAETITVEMASPASSHPRMWTKAAVGLAIVAALMVIGSGVRYALREMDRDPPELIAQRNQPKPMQLEEPSPKTEPPKPAPKPAVPGPPKEKPPPTPEPSPAVQPLTPVSDHIACMPYDPDGNGRLVMNTGNKYWGWVLLDCGRDMVILGNNTKQPKNGTLWAKTDLRATQTPIK